MKYKLAELLLRRKELSEKVAQLSRIKEADVFRPIGKRVQVNDSLDDLTVKIPLLAAREVTAEYDHYAKQLRLTDGLIQQANWTTEIETEHDLMQPAPIEPGLLKRDA